MHTENIAYTIITIICAFGIVAVLAFAIIDKQTGVGFTEVYFGGIPSIRLYTTQQSEFFKDEYGIIAKDEEYPFNFTVASYEAVQYDYVYIISWEDKNKTGTFSLNPGEKKVIKEGVTPTKIYGWKLKSKTVKEWNDRFDLAKGSWIKGSNDSKAVINNIRGLGDVLHTTINIDELADR